MLTEYPVPVRYVLYTHYPEGNDFKEYRDNKTPTPELSGVKFLVDHLKGLRGLLTWPGYEGLLVLFYSPGLAECLAGIGAHTDVKVLEETCDELKFTKAVRDYLDEKMRHEFKELLPRLRFITALDLHRVFGRVTTIGGFLETWMVGDMKGIRYDSPKIVEAIVRLRLLGSGIPVFRVDHDVLFRGDENRHKKNLEFSSTIGSCLTAYQLRRDSPKLSSFIFSASYDHEALQDANSATDFHAWGRAFATRVFPALPVNESLIHKTLNSIGAGEPEADSWDRYAADSFNPSLARRFFGFEGNDFKTSQNSGIATIGAHPRASVISGAMLYLSDGAILDLPPFSNFRLNVSWIDDHLKYCLHRELRHLGPTKLRTPAAERTRNTLLTYSKIDDVVVHKAGRKVQGDLRKYIFDVYLPTLLRGTIMDAWITANPLFKFRAEELAKDSDALLREASGGPLPATLQRALEACEFRHAEKAALEIKLREVALKRISEVRRQWGGLTENGAETFASLWAKGQAQLCCSSLRLTYPGIVANDNMLPTDADISDVTLLHGALILDLHNLVEDAKGYIEWTLNWPRIVQVVRSIEQGTLRTDLNFSH
jgi:hypothetical protein